MTAQIINLADYRKAKEAEQVRKVVNDYFAAHSQTMAWWLSETPARLKPRSSTVLLDHPRPPSTRQHAARGQAAAQPSSNRAPRP